MTQTQVTEALELLSHELEVKYEGAAMVSVTSGHFMLIQKTEEGTKHVHSDAAIEIVKLLVDDLKTQKLDNSQVLRIYQEYPRKKCPEFARRAIKKALRDTEIPVPRGQRYLYLLTATILYATWVKKNGKDPNYIPHPATWFNGKSYLNKPDLVIKTMKEVSANAETALFQRKTH